MFVKNLLSPFTLPIFGFAAVITVGAIILHSPVSLTTEQISWVDAVFTSTSATCVTGLIVVDTGSYFSGFGQAVILALFQIGGLGIMTYSSLIFYLWRRRVSLTDRIAVGQSLLHDPSFHLGRFLVRVVSVCFVVEILGAVILFVQAPEHFSAFSALFHSVSAFCNAGFSLFPDSLVRFSGDAGINLVFVVLITLGGLGFAVLMELFGYARQRLSRNSNGARKKLNFHTRTVLKTSLFLVLVGWAVIFVTEYVSKGETSLGKGLLTSLFQSVTCRTAGFNTLDVGMMTNAGLAVMMFLMFVGGSPGSTAGGIKTTTFRTLVAFAVAQIKGRRQAVVGKYAVDSKTVNKALTLVIFAIVIVTAAVIFLNVAEGKGIPHPLTRGQFLELMFEVFSAFGTVGLSMGVTGKLTVAGKIIITLLMFVGRLGPIVFLSALQSWQTPPRYAWPEEDMLIG